jgi:hypothetical protein
MRAKCIKGLCANGKWLQDEGDGGIWLLGIGPDGGINAMEAGESEEIEAGITQERKHLGALAHMSEAGVLTQIDIFGPTPHGVPPLSSRSRISPNQLARRHGSCRTDGISGRIQLPLSALRAALLLTAPFFICKPGKATVVRPLRVALAERVPRHECGEEQCDGQPEHGQSCVIG